jgi:ureidoglycolate dehydrogenase (NAD+)
MSDFLLDSIHCIEWATSVFSKAGVPEDQANQIGSSLAETSLWGIDSHGIARIPHYLNRFATGSISTKPNIEFSQTGNAIGNLHGDDGHGIVLMHKAADHVIDLAKSAGVGVVGVSHSSHCGAIGLYTRKITRAGLIGIAFTHSDALAVPHLGNKAFFGTNPISIGVPTENSEEPLCLDMATSIVPWNYIMNARREEKQVPSSLGVDANGQDSTNPAEIVAVKPMALHKGYAMAFIIDMLCGPLNGMNFGPHITSMYQQLDEKRKLGSLVLAIDPEKLGGLSFLTMASSAAIAMVKTQGDQILFPGEPEYISARKRSAEGIPVTEALAAEFSDWSLRLGVAKPVYI